MKLTKEMITPEYVAGLFEKHDIEPAPGMLYPSRAYDCHRYGNDPDKPACCGMGIVAVEAGLKHRMLDLGQVLGADFVRNFERGDNVNASP